MLFCKVPKILASMTEVVAEKCNQFSNITHVVEVSSEHLLGASHPKPNGKFIRASKIHKNVTKHLQVLAW